MSHTEEAHHLLIVKDLHKVFGATQVLAGIDLEVKSSEVTLIMGPSGTGKSTLLRCINYLEVPTRGTVCLDGEYIGRHPGPDGKWVEDSPAVLARKRQRIGMVFQLFHLFAHLNAIDNIALGPRNVLGRPKVECRELAHQLLDKVHLADHGHKYPAQLSGGQQQRVAIARALAMNPKLLLFDEPTSSLDPKLTHEVLEVMQELAVEGMTMIVVSHELGFARSVADTVVFMDGGKVLEMGPPDQVFEQPQHMATQQFLSHYRWGK